MAVSLQLESIDEHGSATRAYPENERLYHAHNRGQYLLPCDDEERRRLDLLHALFGVARRGQLHNAPISVPQPRILDLGCGTGIWSIELAPKIPQAEILGVDLANIQPPRTRLPQNLTFETLLDIESDEVWATRLGQAPWDLIHMRMLTGAITDWRRMYARIFAHLRPGTGWVEQVEIDWYPRCADNSLPRNAHLYTWANEVYTAFDRARRPLGIDNAETKRLLGEAGFVNIQEEIITIPYSGWPVEQHQKEIGRWFNVALTEGTLSGYALAPLTRINGWTKKQVLDLVDRCKSEVLSTRIHTYGLMYIWSARKP